MSATQIGKTLGLALWLFCYRLCHPAQTRVCWWVAPIYKQVKQGYRYILDFARQTGLLESKKGPPEPEVVLKGSGRIMFQSFKDPEGLLGDAVDAMVVDEAGRLTPAAQGPIRSRRSATLGPARYIGNPGAISGPFRKLCMLGNDPTMAKTHATYRWSWRDEYLHLCANEPIRAEMYRQMIAESRTELTEVEFRRLYRAEETADENSIFRGVMECTYNDAGEPYLVERRPRKGTHYVAGVDVGQTKDYAVFLVLDVDRNRAVYMERHRGVDLGVVAAAHKSLQELWGAPIVVEDNHIGNALIKQYEILGGVRYVEFRTHVRSKKELINVLAVEIAQRRIQLAEMPPLQQELEVYRYDRSPSGGEKYGAPSGEHDDCVMGLALAVWGKTNAIHGNFSGCGY